MSDKKNEEEKQEEMFGPNPSRYRELSKPHASQEAANDALNAFYAGLSELRTKHRITDVTIIARLNSLTDDGEEIPLMSSTHFGNSLEQEAMLARVLGSVQRSRNDLIGKLLKASK